MSGIPTTQQAAHARPPGRPARSWRKPATYLAGSVIAAGCSEVVLVGCYALLDLSPQVSSVIAWFAGALPNYWLNRAWTWRRRDRPDLRREVLPYVAIVVLTLLLAMGATHVVDAALADSGSGLRTALVALTFLGVYVVMFVLRYLLLDRLFGRLDRPRATPDGPTKGAR